MSETERSASATLGLSAEVVASVVVFIYTCGFLVVTFHLSEYHVYSISLFRGQYLAAGVFSFGPLYLTYFVAAILHMPFEKSSLGDLPSPGWPRAYGLLRILGRIVWALLGVYIIAGGFAGAIISILVPSFRGLSWSHWRILSWLMLQALVFAFFLLKAWQEAVQLKVDELQHDLRKNFPLILRMTFCLFALLGYLSYFSKNVYREIPFWVGGGKPEPVKFLLKDGSKDETVPVIRDMSGKTSIPYKLILETDTSYIVLSGIPEEKIIKFNRDEVAGYVVLE